MLPSDTPCTFIHSVFKSYLSDFRITFLSSIPSHGTASLQSSSTATGEADVPLILRNATFCIFTFEGD